MTNRGYVVEIRAEIWHDQTELHASLYPLFSRDTVQTVARYIVL